MSLTTKRARYSIVFLCIIGGVTLGCAALGASGCVDPTRQAAIDALGPEAPGVEEGPTHRPGQPCLLCHGKDGFEEQFSVAGTVYQQRDSEVGLDNALVTITDQDGATHSVKTNCVGNFYVDAEDFQPSYPIFINLTYNGIDRPMLTPVFVEESCADCHTNPAGPDSAGHVYLTDEPMSFPPPRPCPEDD